MSGHVYGHLMKYCLKVNRMMSFVTGTNKPHYKTDANKVQHKHHQHSNFYCNGHSGIAMGQVPPKNLTYMANVVAGTPQLPR